MHPQPAVSSVYGDKVVGRYTDAYRIARVIVGVGKLVQILGGVAFVITLPIGVGIDFTTRNDFGRMTLAGVFVGGIVLLITWILGVFVSALGQLLKANIDVAVNSSPFLVDDQRAKIMSLAGAIRNA